MGGHYPTWRALRRLVDALEAELFHEVTHSPETFRRLTEARDVLRRHNADQSLIASSPSNESSATSRAQTPTTNQRKDPST